MADSGLGRRVKVLRRARGWTQEGLALRLHRSSSWVTKVERGVIAIDSVSTIRELAAVLGVSESQLTGESEDRPVAQQRPVSDLARMLDRPASMLTGVTSETSVSHADLVRAATALRRTYNRSSTRYLSAAEMLPQLISHAVELAERSTTARLRASAYTVLANLYRLGSLELRHRGDHVHARLALDRAAAAAQNADDKVLVAAVTATLCNELMIGGRPDDAASLAVDSADILAQQPPTVDAQHVLGVLRLYGAQAAARAGAQSEAMALLDAANQLAFTDADRHFLIFGPANTAVQRAGIFVDLGKPKQALDACAGLNGKELGSVNRACYFHLHRARAHTMAGDLDDALAALTVAWRTTPHIVMADQLGRQQVADLLDRKRTFSSELRQIARGMGLL